MINKKTKQSMITWKLFSSVRFDEEPEKGALIPFTCVKGCAKLSRYFFVQYVIDENSKFKKTV